MSLRQVDTLKQWMRDWWGLTAPFLIFLVSDMGLPDGTPWWVSWLAFIVSLVSYFLGRRNGERVASESSRREAKKKDELLAQKDEQIEELENKLSAIKGGLQSLIDEQQDREIEKREREEARQAAMALRPENKLLLLELSKGFTLTICISEYDLYERTSEMYRLIERTEVGFNIFELWISDYGRRVVELAGDILSKVRPNAMYPWWQSGRLSSDEQRDLEPQEESHQDSLRIWPRPISAEDIDAIS